MSKYTYTDYDGEGITIERHLEGEGFKLDKFGEGFVWINNEEAPRIALEILKAAGYEPLETGDFHAVGSLDHICHIAGQLEDYIEERAK